MATPTLHSCTGHKTRALLNRLHIFFHSTAILSLFYYRLSHLFHHSTPVLPWALVTASELIFALIWALSQPFRWLPVTRAVYPDRIPDSTDLPGIDVFICTADPSKEPTVEVMNTVLSAMALDYPPEKLALYISDDGGSPLTLRAVEAACGFGMSWVPFCRKYGIKTRCPEAYFSAFGDDERLLRSSKEFKAEEDTMKLAYELFKKNVEKSAGCGGIEDSVVHDRPPRVKVIHNNRSDGVDSNDQTKMPLLVYVSREKRPSHPHRFKAGALNALLRVSGIMTNGRYLLVLDCDMYCNDPASARQAMCFHLDPEMSPSLGFVQFPQMFYNLSKNDIYDGQGRSAYKTKWQGMDGLSGPLCTGTGYYIKRKVLYGSPKPEDAFLHKPLETFGLSNEFVASLKALNQQGTDEKDIISDAILKEASKLASCTFEKGTKWGEEIGYSYQGMMESSFTGYLWHCRGWRSVYLYPERPCFLGCTTIDMKDALVQLTKWASGGIETSFSRFSPLIYGASRMSALQSMCYGYLNLTYITSVAFLLYGTVPQLCLLYGIPLYPKVSNQWFAVFAIIYASSLSQHLYEVLSTGGSVRTWWNEHRIWMIKSVTGCLFGCLDAAMKRLGLKKAANYRLTNKAIDQEKLEKYEKGKFDFQGAEMFMVPLRILAILNVVCFIGGVKTIIVRGNLAELFGQVFISSFTLYLSYPILQELILKKGVKG